MLKAWLRELPDELFPKEAQERIARECAGAETVPQMLIDELSNLFSRSAHVLGLCVNEVVCSAEMISNIFLSFFPVTFFLLVMRGSDSPMLQ